MNSLFTPQNGEQEFDLPNGDDQQVEAVQNTGPTLLVQSAGARQAPLPAGAQNAINAVAGGPTDLSRVNNRVLESWSDAASIRPELSQEAIDFVSSQGGKAAGLAFQDGENSFALVSREDVRRSATLLGVPEQQAMAFFQTQEAAQSWHATAFHDGQQMTSAESKVNELVGEAAGAQVAPQAALNQAMAYLALPPRAWGPNYDLFLNVAKESIDSTLEAAGIPGKDGKSPGELFIAGFTEQWKKDYGKKPLSQSLQEFTAKFLEENAPQGSALTAERLIGNLQSGYASALLTEAQERT